MKEKVEKTGDTSIKPTHRHTRYTFYLYCDTLFCVHVYHYNCSMEIDGATVTQELQRDLRDTKKEAINNCCKLSVVRLMPLLTYPMTLTRPIGRYNSSNSCNGIIVLFISSFYHTPGSWWAQKKSHFFSHEDRGGGVCSIVNLSPIVFAPYHADLRLPLFSFTRDLEFARAISCVSRRLQLGLFLPSFFCRHDEAKCGSREREEWEGQEPCVNPLIDSRRK